VNELDRQLEKYGHEIVHQIGGMATFSIIFALAVLSFVSSCLMFKKAGYSGALGCLTLVPCLNFILMLWFGFANWPILRGKARARAR